MKKQGHPKAQGARLQRQTKDANEQLILSSVRQHERVDVVEELNARLQAEIAERNRTVEALRLTLAQLAERSAELEALLTERTAKLQETIAEAEGLSYSIIHDLRAPLRALQGFSYILEKDYGDILDNPGKDYLRRIATSALRMDKFIKDVLSYSSLLKTQFRLEPVDTDKLLRGILESYPAFQEPDAEIIIEAPLPIVLANEIALTQCFSNLLNNAVKFVPRKTKPQVRISVEPRGKNVRFWIVDNGIGIAQRHFEKIFEVFQRLENTCDGTGIGLPIVRKVAERMGGQVGVESEPGKGSRFWVELKVVNITKLA